MDKINWSRVGLGGVLAGCVLMALAIACAALFPGQGPAFQMHAGGMAWLYTIFVFLFLGTLMTGWYAAIRPRFGRGPRTAALAALAVWLIMVANLLRSVAMSEPVPDLPPGPLLPLLYLAVLIAGSEAGALVYKE